MNGVKIDLKSMRFSYMKFYAQYSEVLFNEPKDFLHPSNKEDEEGGGASCKGYPVGAHREGAQHDAVFCTI
mgnify:CR=1 FL=1